MIEVLIMEMNISEDNNMFQNCSVYIKNLNKNINFTIRNVSVCRSGHRGPLAYPLLCGGIPSQSIG